jgi:hypothetical protein
MPVTYHIDKKKGFIRTRCFGDLTLDEVLDHFQELERDPDCPDRLDVLLDLSELELASIPEVNELRTVSYQIGAIREKVRFNACAIVACKDALFGMMRMFEIFAEEQFRMTCVFRAVGEAEAWLTSQQSLAV